MGNYLLYGRLIAKSGLTDELAAVLIEASKLVATAKGCKLYIIGKENDDKNSVWVTEVWDSLENHDNSLKIHGVRELISKAIPMLGEQPQKGQELEIIGGTGLSASR